MHFTKNVSKRTPIFPNFHSNHPEYQNSDTSSLSDPDRLSVQNFVKIGGETMKELINGVSETSLHMSFLNDAIKVCWASAYH